MRTIPLAFACALAVLAGCMEGGDVSEASLSYQGAQDGGHTERAECSGAGQLTGTGSIQDGQLMVFVVDGAGNQVFAGTYDDALDLEGEAIEGAPGQWHLEAERMAGFDGQYAFSLVCG